MGQGLCFSRYKKKGFIIVFWKSDLNGGDTFFDKKISEKANHLRQSFVANGNITFFTNAYQ